ncbi:carboxypeptidase regulatory-like domain-containing protein [Myxococcus sp. AM011]|uniref:carboxypeptidase regulatory-like domain-containing protein n=1 Tax=Myxococcus sp. AM011 TaxID=2745200 RepID=UPI001594F815|nr:carboxypeptidase regulatory-like domain-containing protein [Myxococcus sp. AM011]NVJ22220.1 carboxypeptidase regulatory-like domain-containing protein [Myxococcus sp. AM011]
MHKWRRSALILGVLTLLGTLAVPYFLKSEDAPTPRRTSTPRKSTGLVLPPPAPRAEGSLRIQGIVHGDQGPLAGVRISATRSEAHQTLSELTCEEVLPHRRGDRHGFADCFFTEPATTLELLLSRQGEAPLYAETVTDTDGRFTLEQLPEGPFTLWALGPRGARLQPGVVAGTQGLQLRLEEGVFLEGTVIDEDLAALPQVQVMAVHQGFTRFFDVETDADGRYRIGPLPVGDYALAFTKDGWIPDLKDSVFAEPVKLLRPHRIVGRVMRQGTPVPHATVQLRDITFNERGIAPPLLSSKQETTDAQGRFTFEALSLRLFRLEATQGEHHGRAEVPMWTHDSKQEVLLSLSPGAMLEGTVKDEAGAAIEGALVQLQERGLKPRYVKTTTDATGHYRLGPLALAPHELELTSPRHFPTSESVAELSPGTKRLDFTLRTPLWVDGVLVDEAGSPVPDMHITVDNPPSEDTDDTLLLAPYEAVSDEQGRFHLNFPTPGPFLLKLLDEPRFRMEELQIQAPDTQVRWVLKRGAAVSGGVFDELDTPLSGLRVRLSTEPPEEGTTNSPEQGVLSETWTDAQGHYAFGGMKPGQYVLEALHDSGAVERFATRHLELRERQEAHVDLRLEAGWTLSGTVVDNQGQPLSGADVFIEPPQDSTPPWRVGYRHHTVELLTRTREDGRFTLRNLSSRDVELRVKKQSFRLAPHLSTGGEIGLDSLHAHEGGPPVRFVMSRQARIHGRVVGPDGKPLTRFRVMREVVEHPRGEFSLDVVAAGARPVIFQAEDLAPVFRQVEVPHDAGVVDLGEVRMSAGRKVAGRVLDAETSAPVESALLVPDLEHSDSVRLHPYTTWTQAYTNKDGRFIIARVDEHSATLNIRAHGYLSKKLTLAPGSQEDLTVRMEKGARVELSVLDAKGRPTSATVFLDREGAESFPYSIEVPAEGPFVVRDLAPGTYRVNASAGEGGLESYHSQRIQIPASGGVSITVKARSEGATLELRVNSPLLFTLALVSGEDPWPKQGYDLSSLRERSLPHEVGKEGTMTFRNLPAGKLTLFLITNDWRGSYRELIDIPETGTVVRDVTPKWQAVRQ